MTSPARRTAALPKFRQPPPLDPPSPSPDLAWQETHPTAPQNPPAGPQSPETVGGGVGDVLRDLPIPRPARSVTLTGTSATSDGGSEVDEKLIVGLAVALLGIFITTAAVVVKRRRPAKELRKPSKRQIRDFARPAVRILVRHLEIATLSPTLVDAAEAAGALGNYIEEGPLTVWAKTDSGLPPGLTDDEGDEPE